MSIDAISTMYEHVETWIIMGDSRCFPGFLMVNGVPE
jgi:hypothetical protein